VIEMLKIMTSTVIYFLLLVPNAVSLVPDLFGEFFSLPKLNESPTKLGQSELVSPVPLGMGTWSWGNKLLWGYDEKQDESISAAWRSAVDGGIRFFDTGDSYGTGKLEGRAESLLGQCRIESSAQGICYGTKLALYPWRQTPDSFVDALKASLMRMQRDKIEIACAHWSASNYFPPQDKALLEGLARCYEYGLCDAVGLSNFGPNTLRKANAFFKKKGIPIAINQFQFSLLSTKPEHSGLIDTCQELGITPVAYSPLALGALVVTPDSAIKSPRQVESLPRRFLFSAVRPGATDLLMVINDIAQQRRKTPAQVCLNWTISKQCLPIVGARTPERVLENLGACGWRLDCNEVDALDLAAASVRKKATQNIFMTA